MHKVCAPRSVVSVAQIAFISNRIPRSPPPSASLTSSHSFFFLLLLQSGLQSHYSAFLRSTGASPLACDEGKPGRGLECLELGGARFLELSCGSTTKRRVVFRAWRVDSSVIVALIHCADLFLSFWDAHTTMSENSTFDLNQGSADTALRRNELLHFEYLEVPGLNEPVPPPAVEEPTDLFPILDNEEHGDLATRVPMQLLNLAEQEKADLLLVYPKAKVEGDCITARHYIFVVKKLLYHLKISQNRIEDVPHPEATARLLCRLSRELQCAPSFESDDVSNKYSDPADCEACLVELYKDMEEYIKRPETASLGDGYVYVRRGTDTYVRFLVAAASALNSCRS